MTQAIEHGFKKENKAKMLRHLNSRREELVHERDAILPGCSPEGQVNWLRCMNGAIDGVDKLIQKWEKKA